jgi:hypothetical protein
MEDTKNKNNKKYLKTPRKILFPNGKYKFISFKST